MIDPTTFRIRQEEPEPAHPAEQRREAVMASRDSRADDAFWRGLSLGMPLGAGLSLATMAICLNVLG